MKLDNVIKNKNENSRQYAYRVIKENIMVLNIEPGECISEIELGNLLNISRTPIREALVRLTEEKLIDVFPQKGSFVSKIDLKLVEEALFLRDLCEKKLLTMACEDKIPEPLLKSLEKNLAYQKIIIDFDENLHKFFDLDNEFHSIIFEYYGKSNVWKSIKRLATHFDRLRLIDALQISNATKTFEQHQEIVNIIKYKKTDIIDPFVSEHLSKFKHVISTYLKKYPHYFLK
ncbi:MULTISPECIES: GntR family transcriptional regulator [Fusobacterium]|uniref:GntR family transcriptional regulator n=1 Tax=Fusobacterium TaxID=848 RepID=UPI001476A32F|nr:MULTISPECIES: GntR family transcriptional regulator [Fusobacterium]NME35520.1 GntR family transcriptional regulator [Fusobacterium sp. FSA-380-WT-3A]